MTTYNYLFALLLITSTFSSCKKIEIQNIPSPVQPSTSEYPINTYYGCTLEIDAQYSEGINGWKSFIEKNVRWQIPIDNGAPVGKYTTIIQFVIDNDGTIRNLKPLTSVGYGMEAEAMRVIAKSKKWKPTTQNGKKISSYRKQPITFWVVDE